LLEAISEQVDEEAWESVEVEAEGSMEVNTIVLDGGGEREVGR